MRPRKSQKRSHPLPTGHNQSIEQVGEDSTSLAYAVSPYYASTATMQMPQNIIPFAPTLPALGQSAQSGMNRDSGTAPHYNILTAATAPTHLPSHFNSYSASPSSAPPPSITSGTSFTSGSVGIASEPAQVKEIVWTQPLVDEAQPPRPRKPATEPSTKGAKGSKRGAGKKDKTADLDLQANFKLQCFLSGHPFPTMEERGEREIYMTLAKNCADLINTRKRSSEVTIIDDRTLSSLINAVDLARERLFGMAEQLVPDAYNLGNVEGIAHTLHISNEQALDLKIHLLTLSQRDLLELPDYLRRYNAALPNNRTARVLAFTDGRPDTQGNPGYWNNQTSRNLLFDFLFGPGGAKIPIDQGFRFQNGLLFNMVALTNMAIYNAIREFAPGKGKGRGNSHEDLKSLFKMFLDSLLHGKKDDYAGPMLMKMMEDWWSFGRQRYNLSSPPPLKKFTLEEDDNFLKFYDINIDASVLAEDLVHVVSQWQEEVRGTAQSVQGEILTAFAEDLIYYEANAHANTTFLRTGEEVPGDPTYFQAEQDFIQGSSSGGTWQSTDHQTEDLSSQDPSGGVPIGNLSQADMMQIEDLLSFWQWQQQQNAGKGPS